MNVFINAICFLSLITTMAEEKKKLETRALFYLKTS